MSSYATPRPVPVNTSWPFRVVSMFGRPRMTTGSTSPLARATWTPGTRWRASATELSGSLPMSWATMESTNSGLFSFISCAVIKLARTPDTVTASRTTGVCKAADSGAFASAAAGWVLVVVGVVAACGAREGAVPSSRDSKADVRSADVPPANGRRERRGLECAVVVMGGKWRRGWCMGIGPIYAISPRGTFMNRIRSPRDEDEWRRGSRHAWRDGDRAPGRGVQERPRKGSLDIGGGRAAAIPSAARSPFPRGPVAIRGTGNVDKEQQPHRLRIRLIRHNSYGLLLAPFLVADREGRHHDAPFPGIVRVPGNIGSEASAAGLDRDQGHGPASLVPKREIDIYDPLARLRGYPDARAFPYQSLGRRR